MIEIADAGEIKARVSIEYDGSGIDAAKEDLAKLGELAGGIGGEGGIGDAIAAMGDQFAEGTKGAEGLTEALSENEDALKANEEAISEVNDALDEHQQVAQDAASAQEAFSGQVEETAKQLKEVPAALDNVTKSAQATSTQVAASGDSFDTVSEQVAAFQDIIADPAPHQALQDYLTTNQQSVADFTKAIGSENADILANLAQPPNITSASEGNNGYFPWWNDAMQQAEQAQSLIEQSASGDNFAAIGEHDLGFVPQTWNDASGAAKAASASITDVNSSMAATAPTAEEANKAVQDFFGQGWQPLAEAAPTAADAEKAVAEFFGTAETGAEKTGGIFSSIFGENGLFGGLGGTLGEMGGAFGDVFGGLMMGLDSIARPLFAMQMLGTMVSGFGSWLYNTNLAMEGPGGASNPASFTSQVNQLGLYGQESSNQFGMGIGQGLNPSLNAMNYSTNQNQGSDPWAGIGRVVGGSLGSLLGVGELALGDFLGGPASPTGSGLVKSGNEILANEWAAMNGQPLPFQGKPNPSNIYYGQDSEAAWLQSSYTGTTGPTDPMGAYEHAIAMRYGGDSSYPVPAPNAAVAADWSYFNTPGGLPISGGYIGSGPGGSITTGDVQNQLYGQDPSWFTPIRNALGGFSQLWNQSSAAQQTSGGLSGEGGGLGSFFSGVMGAANTLFTGGVGAPGFMSSIGNWFSSLFGGGGGEQAPSGFGCFVAGTPILMADGTQKPIEALRRGEQVLGCEGTTQYPVTVRACMTFLDKQTYQLKFSNGKTLTLTDSHPISTPYGWKALSVEHAKLENPDLAVSPLHIGDFVYTVDGVRSLVLVEEKQREQVYNITVSGAHTYYANGVLVHNVAKGMTANLGQQAADQFQGITLPHMDLGGMASSLASSFSGIQLPHLDLGSIGSSLGGAFSGIQLPHLDLGSIGSSLGGAFSGIQLPHLDLGSMASSLSGAFSGIQLPHLDLGNIGSSLAGAFSGISLPPIPNFGSMIQGALGGMFSGISLPPIPDVGSMIQGALGGMFSGISLPPIPDLGGMIQGALGGIFSGIQLPQIPDFGSMINGAISGIFGSVHMPQIPDFGAMINGAISGIFSSIQMPMIPGFASGIEGFSGGLAMVGEAGPELVSLPSGSSVYPLTMGSGIGGGSLSLGGGGGGGVQTANIIVQLDSQTLISLMGVSLMQTINVSTGKRSW